LREPNGEDAVWVGAPLRVHRRCDRLMFDVSNRIAYGGDLMIYGTAGRGDYAGASAWIDVQSTLSHGHWVPEEGRALQSLLTELAAAGVPAREIRIISPFRKVVRESREPAKARFGWTFAQENVGTVHTVQGQEADVVVLVLGTGPDNAGARRWAAEKPNLLNVAVSRAKRRLYVIGNRANWQNLRYFHVLAHALPERDYQN
jgi:superfamily I DNA and/or RNA helicase